MHRDHWPSVAYLQVAEEAGLQSFAISGVTAGWRLTSYEPRYQAELASMSFLLNSKPDLGLSAVVLRVPHLHVHAPAHPKPVYSWCVHLVTWPVCEIEE